MQADGGFQRVLDKNLKRDKKLLDILEQYDRKKASNQEVVPKP